MKKLFPALALLGLAPLTAQAAVPPGSIITSYTGNSNSGFNGSVGRGTLTITSTPDGSIMFGLAPFGGTLGSGNDAVFYLDTKAGGLTSTSALNDNGDGGRTAVSGANTSTPSRTTVTFAPGFGADYAIDFGSNFTNLFNLAAGSSGNNSLTFIPVTTSTFSISLNPTQAASIGLLPGGTFSFVGTLISETAYRSNETFGTSVTTPGAVGDTPNAGFNGTQVFGNSDTYTLAPEPSGLATVLMVAGVLGVCVLARRRQGVQSVA